MNDQEMKHEEELELKGAVNCDFEEDDDFYYYPQKKATDSNGNPIDFFHLSEPNGHKIKANKLVVSGEMTAMHIENLISACTKRIVLKDSGEEVPSSKNRSVIAGMKYSDQLAIMIECNQRFVEALIA